MMFVLTNTVFCTIDQCSFILFFYHSASTKIGMSLSSCCHTAASAWSIPWSGTWSWIHAKLFSELAKHTGWILRASEIRGTSYSFWYYNYHLCLLFYYHFSFLLEQNLQLTSYSLCNLLKLSTMLLMTNFMGVELLWYSLFVC